MRIIIDLQGAQTESRFRGIGRYTMSLAQAIARKQGKHEVILALSGLFPDTIESIRAAFDCLLPQENIRVWYAPGPVRECEKGNERRREAAEHIREAFLAGLQPDVVLVSSLFEGYLDDAVTSVGVFASQTRTAVIMYDLIPLFNPDAYLKPYPAYARYYQRKIEHLKRADIWLAISESSAMECRKVLGLPGDLVAGISTACDPVFRPIELEETVKQQLLTRFNITQPFILNSGGADARKNLPRLIRAYAKLPAKLRDSHQLLLAGKTPDIKIAELKQIAKLAGLHKKQLLFTGYISDDELVRLYNLCAVFIFPSLHEGFGLPALEAMSCGAAVIGANTTSLPEVIDRQDALFDPHDESAITQKLTQVLSDAAFRTELIANGLEQAKRFSWDESAQRAIAAMEHLYTSHQTRTEVINFTGRRPRLRLAYVSPLPPEKTGIASYSAELLPELARHYEIDVICMHDTILHPSITGNYTVRSAQWFTENSKQYDRVLYHFGNSPFHQHMLTLLEDVPGTVVLHDFYLSSLMAHLEEQCVSPYAWAQALYHAHGYSAVRERYHTNDTGMVTLKYPVNLQVLQNAIGVIVHSGYSRSLANDWYGKGFADAWSVIPHLRAPGSGQSRVKSRLKLGFRSDAFIICSFGFIDCIKLNHRLLHAFLHSTLAQDPCCVLVFVGENHGGEYGKQLLETIRASRLDERVLITGWVDTETFREYLTAADIAVQLRALSRGETSGTILDCMNHALATIVNANGSAAELPADAVLMLPDTFEDAQLVDALEALRHDQERIVVMGKRAQEVIQNRHAPNACAKLYAGAIERFYVDAQYRVHALVKAIANIDDYNPTDAECRSLANAVSQSLQAMQPNQKLLLDITSTSRTDIKTGIERVARALVIAFLESLPAGYRVEPVYLSHEGGAWHYRYASRYTLGLLECPQEVLADEMVEPQNGDILLVLDLSGHILIEAAMEGLFKHYRNIGVAVYSFVYDLLPVQLPQFFPPGTDSNHAKWLKAIALFDGAVCISQAVADEFNRWLETNCQRKERQYKIGWFHLGADIENSAPSRGVPKDADQILSQLTARPCFLMVGTIEPRKGYLQVIDAFTRLWHKGIDISLVIVGKEGWLDLPDNMRRNIPEIINRLKTHPELNRRLFWIEGISDEFLKKIYAAGSCLIAASYGEGFGLPIIEAARHKLPIIARDIPVFREVAGEHAFYFSSDNSQALAYVLNEWLENRHNKSLPGSEGVSYMTWEQSVRSAIDLIIGGNWPYRKVSAELRKKTMEDHLNLIHKARVHIVSTLLPPGDVILDLGGANCPLYKMGYPHRFKKLYLIGLPPDARSDMYKEIVIDPNCDGGEVVIKYGDMTELYDFPDESVDFVWSGQSIEHVPLEAGIKMCRSVFRVLKKGGAFCLDTPNRRLTEIHTRKIGSGFIHPEHCIEYYPDHLKKIMEKEGFKIRHACGICEMPSTLATGEFCYEDFIFGRQITDDVTKGYIQFFHCVKP